MDTVSKRQRSEIMSRIKNKNSKIETLFCKELRKHGIKYHKNSAKYFGKPDIVLKKYNFVIFIDSCFWHGCKKHCRIPHTKKVYWIKKIGQNIKRDKEVTKHYRKIGWKIFRVWEHELKHIESILLKILRVK